jgi:MFS family permease
MSSWARRPVRRRPVLRLFAFGCGGVFTCLQATVVASFSDGEGVLAMIIWWGLGLAAVAPVGWLLATFHRWGEHWTWIYIAAVSCLILLTFRAGVIAGVLLGSMWVAHAAIWKRGRNHARTREGVQRL